MTALFATGIGASKQFLTLQSKMSVLGSSLSRCRAVLSRGLRSNALVSIRSVCSISRRALSSSTSESQVIMPASQKPSSDAQIPANQGEPKKSGFVEGDFLEIQFVISDSAEDLKSDEFKKAISAAPSAENRIRFVIGSTPNPVWELIGRSIMSSGHSVGSVFELAISPEDRGAEYDPNLIMEFERKEMGDLQLEVGDQVEAPLYDPNELNKMGLKPEDVEEMTQAGIVKEVNEKTVKIDFNELDLDITYHIIAKVLSGYSGAPPASVSQEMGKEELMMAGLMDIGKELEEMYAEGVPRALGEGNSSEMHDDEMEDGEDEEWDDWFDEDEEGEEEILEEDEEEFNPKNIGGRKK